jgi:hypothetical protein
MIKKINHKGRKDITQSSQRIDFSGFTFKRAIFPLCSFVLPLCPFVVK